MMLTKPGHRTTPAFSSLTLLRVSVGIIYLWFGVLKFFHGISPAEQLAMATIHRLTLGWIPDRVNIFMLACWESTIGVLFILGKYRKPALRLMLVHMGCTFLPFVMFPARIFNYSPYGLSLTGQYIMKNIVFISVGIVLWQAEKNRVSSVVSRLSEGQDQPGREESLFLRSKVS